MIDQPTFHANVKGIIAMDVDGTLTAQKHQLGSGVKHLLENLMAQGWICVFLTGRTYSFVKPVLEVISGSYYLGVQNGASLYACPEDKLLSKHHVRASLLPVLDAIFQEEGVGMLVESGKENRDICYFRSRDFPGEDGEYIQFRRSISKAKWQEVDSFEDLPIKECAVAKFFAKPSKAQRLEKRIQELEEVRAMLISDPFRRGYQLGLVGNPEARKERALGEVAERVGKKVPIIAAGDDYNDEAMLRLADFRIVMSTAPAEILVLADILSSPASESGVVSALEKAVSLY